ncbi:hypothetical protein KUTeg_014307 [Tegillarca granosa]|uniref:Aldose 1-epimerase n=1 Tax=Tegillarca granosa TaxID=220873 RepID=A0ABQ9F1M5_TEGGR|nr:hypothetical protein KUTeg_014307 [Tegillarca granosa]
MSDCNISKECFGKTKEGVDISRFTLTNSKDVTVSIINYGCIVTNIIVPDKDGKKEDICLGFEDMEGYETNLPYFGAVCGRVANRIAGGKFTLEGKEYELAVNNGPNALHGGLKGFDKKVWQAEMEGNKLVLKYVSADGEEGYPGELTTTVTYQLTEDNELVIEYTATTTKATLVNLTNHSYFNLGGQGSVDINEHLVTINAETYTPFIENIPTGKIDPVEGTPYDMRTPVRLGDRLKDVNSGTGYDNNFCLGEVNKTKHAARVVHPPSGRVLDMYTTEPGLQFYTAYYVDNLKGKGGAEQFPTTVLKPGNTYKQRTSYKFGTL